LNFDCGGIAQNQYAFFFYYLETAKPLLSPVGPLALLPETSAPERLQDIEYEQP
jgi:hypothetical protein